LVGYFTKPSKPVVQLNLTDRGEWLEDTNNEGEQNTNLFLKAYYGQRRRKYYYMEQVI
jgi:hypothetical protein